jgi:hypothetical protein
VLKVTKPVKLQGLVISGVGVGVKDIVGVGVGVNVNPLATIESPKQGFIGDVVGVGVGVGVVVGVTVGVGVTAQSKIASKSILQTCVGVGVGVGQVPLLKKESQRSGQELRQGLLPNKRQGPSKTVDKHQQLSIIE